MNEGIHSAVMGILQELPRPHETWTKQERDRWLAAFIAIVTTAYPTVDDESTTEPSRQ
jgi:hypothetical protein